MPKRHLTQYMGSDRALVFCIYNCDTMRGENLSRRASGRHTIPTPLLNLCTTFYSSCGEGSRINEVYVGSPMYASTNRGHPPTTEIQNQPHKSSVLVFGSRLSRKWTLGDQIIKEDEKTHHLGILRSVACTIFALHAVGARTICLPTCCLGLNCGYRLCTHGAWFQANNFSNRCYPPS